VFNAHPAENAFCATQQIVRAEGMECGVRIIPLSLKHICSLTHIEGTRSTKSALRLHDTGILSGFTSGAKVLFDKVRRKRRYMGGIPSWTLANSDGFSRYRSMASHDTDQADKADEADDYAPGQQKNDLLIHALKEEGIRCDSRRIHCAQRKTGDIFAVDSCAKAAYYLKSRIVQGRKFKQFVQRKDGAGCGIIL
jgi:hypothetical protein